MQTQIARMEPTTVSLRMDFALAQSWADLELLCERIDAAYRRGDLDLVAAEELSVLAAVTAAGVPEDSSISAAALLGELPPVALGRVLQLELGVARTLR